MRFVTAFVYTLLAFVCSSPGHADKRVALVLGNGGYENTPSLPNPVNDANDMAAALRELGFEVIVETNANKHGLETALAKFGRLSQNADAALFYYAGHGSSIAAGITLCRSMRGSKMNSVSTTN
jgi:uncharacterized caspase-like protein